MSKKTKKAKQPKSDAEPKKTRAHEVLDLLAAGPLTHIQIAEKLEVDRPAVHKVLVKLVKEGKLSRSKDESMGRKPFVYKVSD